MIRHFFSKITLGIYLLIAIALAVWGYIIFKNRNHESASNQSQSNGVSTQTTLPNESGSQNNQNSNSAEQIQSPLENPTQPESSLPSDQSATDKASKPVSAQVNVSGKTLAHITSQHCSSDCQAFSNDLSLLEYCQQACGISPIKNVTNCDDKKDIQKDYCNKDLAIIKKDASICDKIKDANIKQACKNRISQDIIEGF